MVAKSKMPNGSKIGIGAILVFIVNKDTFEKFLKTYKGIELFDDYKTWTTVINYYRYHNHHPDYPQCLSNICQREQDIDYIHGRMFHRSHDETKFFNYKSQFCIKSKKMADQFSFLSKIFFCNVFKDNQNEAIQTKKETKAKTFIFGMAVMPFLCRGVWFSPKLSYHRIISLAVYLGGIII